MERENLIIIGSSAGGPRILKELFADIPNLNACILIVQHMPAFVNVPFTASLDQLTPMRVSLAQDGDRLAVGQVYLAPSGMHLVLEQNRVIRLRGTDKVNFVCPAVDVTMMSLTPSKETTLIGVILTGMGKDGAQGLVHMKSLGALTLAQDEATSIIYGMPKEAVKTGKVDHELPTAAIARKLTEVVGLRRAY